MPQPKSISQILIYRYRTFGKIAAQMEQQLHLLRIIKASLPRSLADHTVHCLIDNTKLIVYADSANWASQLRFHRTTMLKAIEKSANHSITTLQFRIAEPIIQKTDRRSRQAKIPNHDSLSHLRNSINSTANHDPLAASLLKLTETLERLSKKKEKPSS
ncbi:MAG: hypothetical protein Kow0065_01910 [Methylomicrobium sp.]